MKKFFIVVGTVFLTGILGAFITEYVIKVGTLGMDNFKYLIIAGAIIAILVFFLTKRKISYTIAAFIGILLIPYFAFGIGQIDFYMVDDNLAQGITVIEVRPTMDNIAFGTTDKVEVSVWKGPKTLQLHPGENRVKLGRFDMPADTYKGGTVYIGDIQVDIKADLAVMTDPIGGQSIPADRYEEAFSSIKNRMTGSVGGFNIKLMNSALNGAIGTFTISVGSMKQPLPIPEFKYPGMGGPDVTLDITLDEMGKPDPAKMKAIVDMPPGVGGAFPSMPGVEFN